MPRVSSWSLSSAPCPGLATEHFTVLALVRFDMCQTLMAAAIYSLESIYSVEFGLSLRPLLVVYMLIDASLTACHDKFQVVYMMIDASLTACHVKFQTPMTSAISA